MKRIKLLGLALLASFAIGAVSAAAAQAVTEFHSDIKETRVFGEQEGENVFQTPAGKMKCKRAIFDSLNLQQAEAGKPGDFTSKMWAVEPEYGECTAFGLKATVDNPPAQTGSACDYYLFADTKTMTITGTPLPATGKSDVACEIKITVPNGNCNVVINQQSPATPNITFTNVLVGGLSEIKMTWAVEGLTYTVEGPKGVVCGEPGVHNDGKLLGNVLLAGYEAPPFVPLNQENIEWE